jgi:hypothetical protein
MGINTTIKTENNTDSSIAELWTRFTSAASQDDYLRTWLALQCSRISNATQGVLVMGNPETDSFAPVSKWPEEGGEVERLADVSDRVLDERCGLLVELPRPSGVNTASPGHYGLAYPILINGRLHGVVAVEVATSSEGQLKAAMDNLQWGASWLELLFCKGKIKEDQDALERLKSAVDMLAGVLAEDQFEGASMTFVTEMATLLRCDRVSLGFVRRNRMRVKAISHSAQFGKRMNLIRSIENAMDEARTQRREIRYPMSQQAEVLVTRDHEQLSRQYGAGSILTMPLYGSGRYYGALTLERPADLPFSEKEAEFCRSVTGLTAPALENKRQNDRLLIGKITDSFIKQLSRLFGLRYIGRKLVILFLGALVAFFSVATGEYWLSADTALEGAVRRVVAAPFNGYIREAEVRAGDVVEARTLMCSLDDRDLRLERLNWLSQRSQLLRRHQEALAKHNWAEVNIIKAQLDQAEAQLSLVESKLKRTRIHAPFDGIVLSGDLSQMLGGFVEQGKVLFEVAPLNAYRVIMEVDERRIADVHIGQHGTLVLSALPNDRFDFFIEKITPISTAREGRNYFRVEGHLNTVSERLRPGMEGIGKIYIDHRKLISIWSRNLVEWIRLRIWSWWP